jgi:Spy/CpxP family protein refolding chaperone
MKRFAIRQLAPVAAVLFTLGVALASAQDVHDHPGKMGGSGRGAFGMRALSRLDLSDSQKADVQRIMDAKKATFESLRERMRTDWQALDAAADAQSPSTSEVGAAYLKVRSDREAMRAEHKATMEQIRSILTPEQKDKLDTMLQKRQQRFEGRRGMRERSGR